MKASIRYILTLVLLISLALSNLHYYLIAREAGKWRERSDELENLLTEEGYDIEFKGGYLNYSNRRIGSYGGGGGSN